MAGQCERRPSPDKLVCEASTVGEEVPAAVPERRQLEPSPALGKALPVQNRSRTPPRNEEASGWFDATDESATSRWS